MINTPINTPGMSNEEELQKKQQQPITGVQQPPARKLGSGSYTNLQNYLQSNKGAGQQIAGRITSDVTGKESKASGAVGEAAAVGAAIQAQKEKTSGAGGVVQTIKDVAAGTGKAEDLDARAGDINYLTSGGYATEAEQNKAKLLGSEVAAKGAIGQLSSRATDLGSESGRYGILSDVYKRPSYSTGQQRLDQLFLQQSGGNALQNLQKTTSAAAATQSKGLGDVASTGYGNLADILKEGSTLSGDVTNALTSGLGSYIKREQDELAAKQASQAAAKTELSNMLSNVAKDASGNPIITDVQARRFKELTGMDIGAGMSTYNLFDNPNDVINTITATDLQPNAFVSESDLAAMNALAKYGGGTTAYTAAGTGPKNLVSSSIFDKMKEEQKKFEEEAAKQIFTGAGTYQTGRSTDSLGFSGDIGGVVNNILGPNVSITRPTHESLTTSSSVADYLKDPEAFKTRTTTSPVIQKNLEDVTNEYKKLQDEISKIDSMYPGPSGMDEYYGPRMDNETMAKYTQLVEARNKLGDKVGAASLAWQKENARAEADKQVASSIEKFLKEKGYGKKVLIQRTKEGSGSPIMNTGMGTVRR